MGLEEISAQVKACEKCQLCKSRTNAVPGEGSPHAKIMLVGEAPGENEDLQGRPFVGRAGQLLNEMLAEIGLRRENVFITNIVKCRPPGNRDPLPEEKAICSPYLDMQIECIQPKIIVCLGRHSAEYLFTRYGIEFPGITLARGKPYKVDSLFGHFTLFPVYHPAATIYNQQLRPVLRADFQKLQKLVSNV
ncbi:MAG: type-4 uracil-DNA glycosylase [Candidatus Micrarchaeota archaeon]|nr:type-4 uracil-DNA glycosylase [Candidatus Micrarchaeota archaeon]